MRKMNVFTENLRITAHVLSDCSDVWPQREGALQREESQDGALNENWWEECNGDHSDECVSFISPRLFSLSIALAHSIYVSSADHYRALGLLVLSAVFKNTELEITGAFRSEITQEISHSLWKRTVNNSCNYGWKA